MSQPYPLDQKLPADVFPSAWGRRSKYISYPVFSWPWFWHRSVIYGPIGFCFGAVMSIQIGFYSESMELLLGCLVRLGSAWAAVMLIGPAFATLVRTRDLPQPRESQLIVVAVALGIVVSYAIKTSYEEYIGEVVRPIVLAKGTLNAIPSLSTVRALGIFFEILLGYIIVMSGGGRALINYFSELRRWQSHGAQQEIAAVKRERDDVDRKLTVLQAQVEPHFLYNTLASVRSLVRSDPVRAEATIDALVDHLRATLPKFRAAPTRNVSLQEQLEICRSYLDVMRIRMGERLKYSIDVAPAVAALPFPPLMLVPLVENAIKHGVERKPGECSIAIHAVQPDPNTLEVAVSDDGAGLREGPSEGVGLANIREQLATRYGDRAALVLEGRAGGGVIARVKVPVERVPQ